MLYTYQKSGQTSETCGKKFSAVVCSNAYPYNPDQTDCIWKAAVQSLTQGYYCARNADSTISYEVYHHAVKQLNISFSEPATDQCDECAYYEQMEENSFKEQE